MQPINTRYALPRIMFVALAAFLLTACDRSAPSDSARVVTIWSHQGQPAEHEAMQQIIAAFNAAHADENLRAEIQFFPDRQYADKVSIAALSNNLPDVLDIDGPYVGPWAAEGLLAPLDRYITPEMRADLLPSLIEQGSYDGQVYALGAFESALVVYYDCDLLKRVGIEPPRTMDNVWTWDEFVAALEAVRPHVATPLSLHMDDQSDEWFTYAFAPLIWSGGGQLIDTQNHQVVGVLDSPQNVATLTRWQKLFTTGLAEATSTNPDPFSAGLVAFDWTGHWMLPKFEAATDLNFCVMPLPKMGVEPVAPSGSWCWGLSTQAQDKSAAWELISWLINPEQGVTPIVKANGAVPGRRSAFKNFPQYEEMPRVLMRKQLESASRARPRTPVYLTLTSEFARALRDIAGGADVKPALTAAAEKTQRALDRHPSRRGDD